MDALTHQKVWRIAWPIILSNITIPLVGAVDTAVIGRLPGPDYIAAVALGAIIFDFLFWGLNFLKIGTSGLTSQALGAGDESRAAAHISRAFVIAIGAAVLILLLHPLIIDFALGIFKTEPAVTSATEEYFNIRVWGSPAVLANYVILGSFIALQKTKYLFFHQMLLNITNIVLDLVFVLGLGWEVQGVATATVIANYTACLAGLGWLTGSSGVLSTRLSLKNAVSENLRDYLPLIKLNADIMVRTACLVFSFAFMAWMGSRLGTLFLAANAILLHFQTIMAYGLDGFADAAESLTGRAYGRRSPTALLRAVKYTTIWAGATAMFCSVTYMVFGHQIIRIFSIDPQVIDTATSYLHWLVISPLVSVWSFQLDGIFTGTTHSKEMRNGMLISTTLFVCLSLLLTPLWHNHGLWLAFVIFMAFRGFILWLWFPRIPRSIEGSGLMKSAPPR